MSTGEGMSQERYWQGQAAGFAAYLQGQDEGPMAASVPPTGDWPEHLFEPGRILRYDPPIRETREEIPTPSQRIARLEAALERLGALAQQPASLSSVEIAMNAKGSTQPSCKVYNSDPFVAAEQAKAVYADLLATYRDGQP